MENEPLLPFARTVISDLAQRLDQHGQPIARGKRRQKLAKGVVNRAPMRGRNVAYHDDGKDASLRCYRRGSDGVFRVALAVEAYQLYLKSSSSEASVRKACYMVARLIRELGEECPLLKLYSLGKRGPKVRKGIHEIPPSSPPKSERHVGRDQRLIDLDEIIRTQEQSRLDERKRIQRDIREDPTVRLAKTIATTNRKFRKENPQFLSLFWAHFGAFQFTHRRTEAWYQRMEALLAGRRFMQVSILGKIEPMAPNDPWIASQTSALAQILHEQGKYGKALQQYRRAIGQWEVVTDGAPERRKLALELLTSGYEDCLLRANAT